MDICWFYHRFIPTNIFAFEQSQLDASSAKKRKIQVHADDAILSAVDVCDEVLSRCEVIQSFITNDFITGGKNKLLKKTSFQSCAVFVSKCGLHDQRPERGARAIRIASPAPPIPSTLPLSPLTYSLWCSHLQSDNRKGRWSRVTLKSRRFDKMPHHWFPPMGWENNICDLKS